MINALLLPEINSWIIYKLLLCYAKLKLTTKKKSPELTYNFPSFCDSSFHKSYMIQKKKKKSSVKDILNPQLIIFVRCSKFGDEKINFNFKYI